MDTRITKSADIRKLYAENTFFASIKGTYIGLICVKGTCVGSAGAV